MKKVILLIAIVFSGMLMQAQTQRTRDFVQLVQNLLPDEISDMKLSVNKTTMTVTIPVSLLARMSNITEDELRRIMEMEGTMDIISRSFMTNLGDTSSWKDYSIYYIKLVVKDDYYHNHKKYSSGKLRL